MMSERGIRSDTHDDFEVGAVQHAGVREAVAAALSPRGRLLADDETYVKVRGEWLYLYRAVDKAGKAVDFFLSRQRDVNAAKAFPRKAMNGQRVPAKVTLDANPASHRAVADLKHDGELPKRVVVRSSKYLNNLIE